MSKPDYWVYILAYKHQGTAQRGSDQPSTWVDLNKDSMPMTNVIDIEDVIFVRESGELTQIFINAKYIDE